MSPAKTIVLVLVVVAAMVSVVAVAAVLSARQDYEDELSSSYELEAAGARLLAAGIAEEAALRGSGDAAREPRGQAAADFEAEARRVRSLSRGDAPSERLVRERLAAQRRARRAGAGSGALIGAGQLTVAILDARRTTRELTGRQRRRRQQARAHVRGVTTAWLAVGGVTLALALLVALTGAARRY